MSKTHYTWIEQSTESNGEGLVGEVTACGCSTENVDITDRWDEVSCKRCLMKIEV